MDVTGDGKYNTYTGTVHGSVRASAADQQSCNTSGSGKVCLSPSNVPIKTSPPDVRHHPSGEMPDLTVQDFALALGLRRELASLL